MRNESFEEWFTSFIEDWVDDGGQNKYIIQISEMPLYMRDWFQIDFQDLYNHDSDIAMELIKKHETLGVFGSVILGKLKIRNPEYTGTLKKVDIRIVNLPNTISVKHLKAETMGKLIQIEGVVIQRSKPLVRATKILFKCKECETTVFIEQDLQYRKYPQKCPSCGGGKWDYDYTASEFENYQEIYIQEAMENMENSGTLDKVKVVLRGSLIRSCEAGENIVLVGVLSAYDSSSISKDIEIDYYFDANSLINTTDKETLILTNEDIREIKNLMKQPDHLQKTIKSVAPTIYGYDYIKEALAYQQCEGQVKIINQTRRRGQLHILLAGNPGCGKSEMGEFMVLCHPKGRQATGRGASGVGLTASVVQDNKQFVLKPGSMALADNGFLFVDEIEKMRAEDRGMMHPAMEQQKINIDKADISAELKTRCSVLAACNPIGGAWDNYKTVTGNLESDGKGLPRPLLDRFALIFIVKQNPDSDIEEEVIEHVMNINTNPSTVNPPYTVDLLKKLFAYARTIQVTITEDVTKRLKEFYMILYEASKQDNSLMITRRQPIDLIRLVEASARLHGRTEATIEDAERAICLVAKSLQDYGIDPATGKLDQMTAFFGIPKSKTKQVEEIPVIVERLRNRNVATSQVSRVEVIEYITKLWSISQSEANKRIEDAIKQGLVYCPTTLTLKA